MRYKQLTQLTGVILALFFLALVAGPASGATYNLCTGVVTKTMPGTGEVVTLWGFGIEDSTATCESASVPGPNLEADGTGLTINLRNTLPDPVSLHILGQMLTPDATTPGPTFTTDGSGLRRVMSFSHEAPAMTAGIPGTATYQWGAAANPFRPGTYMLQSGTNPAKQVQMGLYAAVKKDEGPKLAYPGVPYDKEQIVVFHEIDPDIHAAIAAGTYGDVPGVTITSSAFRHPRYFLINGEVFEAGGALDPINAGATWNEGERVLLRFVNAGLETHVPQTLGTYMTTVAEDGNPYIYPKEEYGFELAAAKTKDAIIQPAQGTYPLYDARLNMTNMGDWPGGMLAYLAVGGPATGAPTANPDSATVAEGGTVTVLDSTETSVLANDTPTGTLTAALAAGPTHALAFTFNTDGTFSYTHDGSETTSDSFTYTASDGTNVSTPATVTIAVTPVNDAPVANDDSATTVQNTTVTIDVLANDTDAENDPLKVTNLDTTSTSGSAVINLDNTVDYTAPIAPFTGPDTFTYTANDGTVDSNVAATVTVEVTAPVPNQRPVAVDDNATVVRNSSGNLINVVANDFDPDGTIDPTTLFDVTQPENGTVTVNLNPVTLEPNGTVLYTPNPKFHKQDFFTYRVRDNEGAPSQRQVAAPPGVADEPTVVFVNVGIKP